MADPSDRLSEQLDVPVVNGVSAAVTTVEQLVRLGLRTSRHGELTTPSLEELVTG